MPPPTGGEPGAGPRGASGGGSCCPTAGCAQLLRDMPVADGYAHWTLDGAPKKCSSCAAWLCTICCRAFGKKSGLSLHMRKGHPERYHAAPPTTGRGAATTRFAWDYENMSAIARVEASIPSSVRNVNQWILARVEADDFLRGVTLDIIRNLRKRQRYKETLEAVKNGGEAGAGAGVSAPPGTNSDVDPTSTPRPIGTINPSSEGATPRLDPPALRPDPGAALLDAVFRSIDWELLWPEGGAAIPESLDELDGALVDRLTGVHFPAKNIPKACPRRGQPRPPRSRREARRRLYRDTQRAFRARKARTARAILDGTPVSNTGPIPDGAEEFWTGLFSKGSIPDERVLPRAPLLEGLLRPVAVEELRSILAHKTSGAPGPDGYRWCDLKRSQLGLLASLFNLWLAARRPPSWLGEGVTTLIPKKPGTQDPKEFRPITVCSVVGRLFHCCLASRFERHLPISLRQKGFKRGDGLYLNSKVLRESLRRSKRDLKSISLAFVDLSKAFDSVSHDSLWVACRALGVPFPLIDYLQSFYRGSKTRLRLDGRLSGEIHCTRGIKQGDPLSVHLFNAVVDLATRKLDPGVGFDLEGQKTSFLAYADDIVLLARTNTGLRRSFDTLQSEFAMSGLAVNALKCATLRIDVDGKNKRWVVNPSPVLAAGGVEVRALSIAETYRYLGAEVGAGALDAHDVPAIVRELLARLTRAPLKPHQRMYILREHLLPKIMHSLVLSDVGARGLKHLDLLLRAEVCRWLKARVRFTRAYIHASVADGGLGLACLRYTVPLLRLKRENRLGTVTDPLACVAQTVNGRPVMFDKEPLNTTKELRAKWADVLYASADGKGLARHRLTPKVHSWVRDPTLPISGAGYIQAVHLRANHLLSRSFRARMDKSVDPVCRQCGVLCTTAHVLQTCARSFAPRIHRHNSIAHYVVAVAVKEGWRTQWEPHIRTNEGLLKPDILVWNSELCFVIDVCVRGDRDDLDRACHDKVRKYQKEEILGYARRVSGVLDVRVVGLAVNWRGAVAPSAIVSLRPLLRDRDFMWISVRTLEFGSKIWEFWHKSTGQGRAWVEDSRGPLHDDGVPD